MSQGTISHAGRELRRHRRYRLPSRSHLAAGLAAGETLATGLVTLGLIVVAAGVPVQPMVLAIALMCAAIYGTFSAGTALRHLARLDPRQPVITEALFGWSVAYGCGLGVIVFTGDVALLSRWSLALIYVAGGVALIGLRGLIYLRITEMLTLGRLQLERVAVAGPHSELATYLTSGQIWRQGAQVADTLALDAPASPEGDAALRAFVSRCAARGCTQMVFVSDLGDLDAMEHAAQVCKHFALDVTFAPAPGNPRTRLLDISPLGPNNAVQVVKRPMGLRALVSKRAFDIGAAVSGLILLAPVLGVVAILIRRDSPGPVFYRQARRGFNGEEFSILKFRTMRVMEDGRAMVQARADDPRITRVGAVLRRTSIDELPQLVNVLRGEMSLVGPRPHAIGHDAELAHTLAHYAHRQRVKPGITGWAQVNGFRGDTSSLDKIEGRTLHDIYYIENWSLLLDVWIVLLTVFSRRTRSNAH